MFQEHCQVHGSGFLVLEVKGLLSRDCQLLTGGGAVGVGMV